MIEEKKQNKIAIIEQGYECKDPIYYKLGIINHKSKERVPKVATKHGYDIYCARVKRLDSVTTSQKYFESDNLPEPVIKFMNKNNYKIKSK